MGNTKEYPQDIFSKIDSLERQMKALQLKAAPTSIGEGDSQLVVDNGNVLLSDNNGTTVIGSSIFIPAPTDISLTTGTEVNESWVRVSWTAPVGVTVKGYEIITMLPGQGVVRTDLIDSAVTSMQIQPLQPGEEYEFQVRAFGVTRNSQYAPDPPASIVVGNDTTDPNPVTGFQMFGGFRSVYGTWNENTDYDVQRGKGEYEFEIDVVSTFNSGNQRTWRGKALIGSHLNLVAGVTTYYGRVRARDSSGNFSTWSATLNVNTSQTTTNDLGNGTLVTNHFVAGTISGSIITIDTLNGNRLLANSADIAVLKSGSLTSQIVTIEGTALLRIGRSASPYHYLLQDSNGIRAYRNGTAPFTGGELMFETNTQTGSVLVKGTVTGQFQTAATGQRVVLSEDWTDQIRFYTGDAAESNFGQVGAQRVGTSPSRYFTSYMRSPILSNGGWCLFELRSGSADGTISQYAILSSETTTGRVAYVAVGNTNIDLAHDTAGGRIIIGTDLQFITNGVIQAFIDNAPGGGTGDSILRLWFLGIGTRRLIAQGVDSGGAGFRRLVIAN